jgi:hypothetical protein
MNDQRHRRGVPAATCYLRAVRQVFKESGA